jgi:hypothetical protein
MNDKLLVFSLIAVLRTASERLSEFRSDRDRSDNAFGNLFALLE